MAQNWEEDLHDEVEQATGEQIEALRRRRAVRRKRARFRHILTLTAVILVISLLLCALGLGVWCLLQQNRQPEQMPELDVQPQAEAQQPEAEAPAEPAALPPQQPTPEQAALPDPPQAEILPEEPAEADAPEETEPSDPPQPEEAEQVEETEETVEPEAPAYLAELEKTHPYLRASVTDRTKMLDLELYSEAAILIDVATNTVIAEKNADNRIYPASMTKVMTALVACENIENWDDAFTMRQSIIDPYFIEGASMAGFVANEEVTMHDLLFGAVAPSGAEATFALAEVIAGSEEAYAQLMNEKAAALGLKDTHFVTTSGLHNAEHYTTVREMAVILLAAIDDPHCREALSVIEYRSQPTQQHPDGFVMVNKFNSRIHDRDLGGGVVLGSKTGYTADAMNCCASFGYLPDGRLVICVTAHAWTGDYCIEDHIALYSKYNGIEGIE